MASPHEPPPPVPIAELIRVARAVGNPGGLDPDGLDPPPGAAGDGGGEDWVREPPPNDDWRGDVWAAPDWEGEDPGHLAEPDDGTETWALGAWDLNAIAAELIPAASPVVPAVPPAGPTPVNPHADDPPPF